MENKKVYEVAAPSWIRQTFVMSKYSFTNFFRSKRFFILLLITIIVGAILTGIVAYFKPQSFMSSPLSFYSSWWGMAVTFIIILSAVFFGGDAISSEFENKTGYFLMVNPIRRSSVYFGKLLAAFFAAFLILLVFTLMTIGNGLYYFGSVPSLFFESFAFSVLYIAAAMGLTFFFSSVFKSNSMSIIVTIILFLFVFSLVQELVASLAGIEPWFIITYGAQIIGNVLQSPYPAHVVTTSLHGFKGALTSVTTYNATIIEGITIMLVYFIVSVAAGLFIFENKEFN
ncbi:MAG: ABC transporter permease [Candidatus Micrarchaeaceae archaeon]